MMVMLENRADSHDSHPYSLNDCDHVIVGFIFHAFTVFVSIFNGYACFVSFFFF